MISWAAILSSMKLDLRAKVADPAVAAELGAALVAALEAAVAAAEVLVAVVPAAVVAVEAEAAAAAVVAVVEIAIVETEAAAVVAGNPRVCEFKIKNSCQFGEPQKAPHFYYPGIPITSCYIMIYTCVLFWAS
jgi:hypothetical protein